MTAAWQAQAPARTGSSGLHLASNEYSWVVFYGRENRNFKSDLETNLGDLAKSGVNGYEPLANGPEDVDRLAPLLKRHGIEMRSLYVNSTLHEADKADESIAKVRAIAERAKAAGTRIIVTNPSPIQWDGTQNKDDRQLETQAAALNRLGKTLADLGLVLAYHNHNMELRNAAREFHHMMLATDPKLVTFCLDSHWIYRGAGNSSVALFDIVRLYGQRISEWHLRQSQGGIWSETFGEGDIDYPELAKKVLSWGRPHLVLEIAVEKGTPKTIDPVEAHRRSVEYARQLFAKYY